MNQKKTCGRILFVISNKEYFRNYITSNAISKIEKDCFFLVNEKAEIKIPSASKKKIIYYSYRVGKSRLHWHLFNINTKKYMKRSKTFEFRFLRLPERLQLIYKILSLPLLYQFIALIIRKLTYDKKIENILSQHKPKLVLIPSSGYEGVSFEIIRYAKKLNIPTCLLIDNWDNLCSKTVFTEKPDYLCVWGKQSKEHAMRIHGIKESNIFILGTPRFIPYFQINKSTPSPYSFKYALFAGNALAFDELSTLRELDKIIKKKKLDLKIIYRPHPWRHPRKSPDTFFDYDFDNVILDIDSRLYYKKDLGETYAPPLEYYPRLLSNMEFMICPLSTMLIEGLIFKKRVFAICYDDKVHFTNPKNAYKFYEHFKGIGRLENLFIIDQFDRLHRIFTDYKRPNQKKGNVDLDFFISRNTADYQNVLSNTVNHILEKHG